MLAPDGASCRCEGPEAGSKMKCAKDIRKTSVAVAQSEKEMNSDEGGHMVGSPWRVLSRWVTVLIPILAILLRSHAEN